MKLLRKINNNAAVAQDNRGREMVVLGRGVGFHSMPYELTDLSVVYRTFYDVDPQYYEILSNLPEEALLAAADITEQAHWQIISPLHSSGKSRASGWQPRCITMCSTCTLVNTSWACGHWKWCVCAPVLPCPGPKP